MNPSEPAVTVESITQRFGTRTALDEISLDVAPASIFGLLGPNGSGKTTLFRILTTLLAPTKGTARIAGADVVSERAIVRARIGIVFQSPSLDDKLTVRENLRHQGHLYGLSGERLRRRCEEQLERFELSDRANDRIATLSGGLMRRVELAKSLLHQPEVLILDEPSTGLDPAARAALSEHLASLRDSDGVTCLLTTHLMDEAERCDRIAVLDQGRLVALETPARLKASVGGDVLTVQTPEPQSVADRIAERFHIGAHVTDGVVRIEREAGHEFVTDLIEAFPGELDSVTVGKPTLDDVFVRLTGRHLESD